jgi:translation elongation factor EF-Ts
VFAAATDAKPQTLAVIKKSKMNQKFTYIFIICFLISGCNNSSQKKINQSTVDSVIFMKVHMDVFGVESLNVNEIYGEVDFVKKTSNFKKVIDYPISKDSIYHLEKKAYKKLESLVHRIDFAKLKTNYTMENIPDQPKSTITIKTKFKEFTIEDYGLSGDSELMKIYKIVYEY